MAVERWSEATWKRVSIVLEDSEKSPETHSDRMKRASPTVHLFTGHRICMIHFIYLLQLLGRKPDCPNRFPID